jgi:hypothetical protein
MMKKKKSYQAVFEKINFWHFAIRAHVKICDLLTSKQYHQSDSMKSISLQVINTMPRKVHAKIEKSYQAVFEKNNFDILKNLHKIPC